jgi:hypothetical protein
MARTDSVADLIGEDVVTDYAFVPDRAVVVITNVQLGDGLAGPPNDQPLQILRDDRPLPVDELGVGHLGKVARHRAGRSFPLNYAWGLGVDQTLPGRPPQMDTLHPSPLYPGQSPDAHDGVPAPEVIRNPHTVFYTATPQVGWHGW